MHLLFCRPAGEEGGGALTNFLPINIPLINGSSPTRSRQDHHSSRPSDPEITGSITKSPHNGLGNKKVRVARCRPGQARHDGQEVGGSPVSLTSKVLFSQSLL